MKFLVHGHGFAEIMEARHAGEAVRNFRREVQEVNPEDNIYEMEFDVEPANQPDALWESESRNQHLMAFGYTDW